MKDSVFQALRDNKSYSSGNKGMVERLEVIERTQWEIIEILANLKQLAYGIAMDYGAAASQAEAQKGELFRSILDKIERED